MLLDFVDLLFCKIRLVFLTAARQRRVLDVDLLPFIGNFSIWERSLARGASSSTFEVAFLANLARVVRVAVVLRSVLDVVVVAGLALPTLAI